MNSNAVDGGHLKAFIERIEKLEEEKRALADDVKDVYGEAKSTNCSTVARAETKLTEISALRAETRRKPREGTKSPTATRTETQPRQASQAGR